MVQLYPLTKEDSIGTPIEEKISDWDVVEGKIRSRRNDLSGLVMEEQSMLTVLRSGEILMQLASRSSSDWDKGLQRR